MNIEQATKQLERSERGQMTAKLLLDFLNSDTVKYLDGQNFEAVATLTTSFALGTSAESCAVIAALEGVVQRNRWVQVKKEKPGE